MIVPMLTCRNRTALPPLIIDKHAAAVYIDSNPVSRYGVAARLWFNQYPAGHLGCCGFV